MGPLTQASPGLKRPHNARGAPSGAESKAAARARARELRCNRVGETKAAARARARGTAIASVGAWGPKETTLGGKWAPLPAAGRSCSIASRPTGPTGWPSSPGQPNAAQRTDPQRRSHLTLRRGTFLSPRSRGTAHAPRFARMGAHAQPLRPAPGVHHRAAPDGCGRCEPAHREPVAPDEPVLAAAYLVGPVTS